MEVIRKVLSYLQLLLYPVSLLYGLIIWIRNKCYDWEILTAIRFDLPIIAVGSLSVGGSGKTPHVEYLLSLLIEDYSLATLSRGYQRKTRGYQFATATSTALEIGDEPMLFHLRFPGVAVAVGEDRILALPQILMDAPETKVVILDDAFQHRSVLPGLNILVTEFHRRFTRDHIVPLGRLREGRRGYRRADVIIVSKCPLDLDQARKELITHEIAPLPGQGLFFTSMAYETPHHITSGDPMPLAQDMKILLVTGIADPLPVRQWLESRCAGVVQMKYPDHYYYRASDLKAMSVQLEKMGQPAPVIITTEKDAVRLRLLEASFPAHFPIYVLPITVTVLFGEAVNFNQRIFEFIQSEQKRTGNGYE